MPCVEAASTIVERARDWGLLSADEAAAAKRLFASCFPFAEQLGRAESIHVHVKVDDTRALPRDEFREAGGRLDHEKEGFAKFQFPEGVNLIFSSIAVSQDELADKDGSSRRPRPFVDHFGIDMRAETPDVEQSFAAIPALAEKLGWGHVPQGGPERGVHCCHVEVKRKHWVYPRDETQIPLEFAFGKLKMNPTSGGCDLRPTDPQRATGGKPSSCCGGLNDKAEG